jgi:hypothetical protein
MGGCCEEVPIFWFDIDYLYWWIRNAPAPALVTNGGAIATPGGAVLFGGSNLDDKGLNGLRLETGLWVDPQRMLGFDVGAFGFEQRSVLFGAVSNGAAGLAIPFFDPRAGVMAEAAIPVAGGGVPGSITFASHTNLWGVDGNADVNIIRQMGFSVDGQLGLRFIDLYENLALIARSNQVVPINGVPIPGAGPGSTVTTTDSFRTSNHFYGGQVGARATWMGHLVSVEVFGKLAMGVNDVNANINGTTILTSPANQVLAVGNGGIFALPTNEGSHHQTRFAIIPELGINLGVRLTDYLTVRFGYSALYWYDVVRPGGQIDRNVNPALLPASPFFNPAAQPARPAFTFHGTDFWAQGINLGLEFRF